MTSVLVGQPFDIVKIRMQAQSSTNPLYKTPMHCIRAIYENEGFRAFYKGTTAPLLSAGVCTSVRFVVNELTKRMMRKYNYLAGKENPHIVSSTQLTI